MRSDYTPKRQSDYFLEIARGNVPGIVHVNKFGRATDVDSGVLSDIWDRANAADAQDIWVAPTTARTHQITSSSASDTSAGAGARTVQVDGLTAWDAAEVSETVTMNGTSNVATANAYVIIHRIKVLTKGATNVNVGAITATADTDGTITAQILTGQGQTQMAVYGIPSTQKAYMLLYYSSFNKSGGAAGTMDISVLSNPEPDVELLNFQVKHTAGLLSTASSHFTHNFTPQLVLPGPCLLKMQVLGGVNDLDISAGFDLLLIDN